MKFSERLIKAREHAGITQEELALASKVSQGTISKIERGDSDESRYVVQLAIVCGVRPEWLALEDGDMLLEHVYKPNSTAGKIYEIAQELSEYQRGVLLKVGFSLAEPDGAGNSHTQ